MLYPFIITCSLAFFLAALPTVRAGPLSAADAMLVLDSPQATAQALAASGRTVQCRPGKSIGVWVEGMSSLDVQGLTVQDCAYGVVVMGIGHTIRGVTIQGMPIVGMLIGGTDGQAYQNTVLGGDFGIVLTGLRNAVWENLVQNVLRDGMLVVGQDNTVERNTVHNSRRYGLNVGVMIPGANPLVGISAFAVPAGRNVFRGNILTSNDKLDLRQYGTKCLNHEGHPATLANTYSENVYDTKSHWCLQ